MSNALGGKHRIFHFDFNSSTMRYVVILQNRTAKAVPADWIQSKNPHKLTKIFISSDENKEPDFTLPVKYFNQESDACYYGFCMGKYGKCIFEVMKHNLCSFDIAFFKFIPENDQLAARCASRKRKIFPVNYLTNKKRVVKKRVTDFIDLTYGIFYFN